MVSSGGAIIDNASMLRNDGIEVNRALCVIDRRPPDANALEENGIELDAVFTMQQIETA